jgi:hypothetical protein
MVESYCRLLCDLCDLLFKLLRIGTEGRKGRKGRDAASVIWLVGVIIADESTFTDYLLPRT